MALFRPGPLVGQVSGRVAGVVFARNRGGAYVRNGPSPVQPRTIYQQAVRNALAVASAAWNDLTDNQRQAWSEWAKLNPIKNRIGESVTLQGNAAYVQLNSRLAFLGIAPKTATPAVGSPSGLLTLSVTADIGAGDFELVFTATPLGTNERLILEGCNVRATDVKFIENRLVVFDTTDAAEASPYEIESPFQNRLGSVAVGDRIYVRAQVVDDRNGLVSAIATCTTVAISTP